MKYKQRFTRTSNACAGQRGKVLSNPFQFDWLCFTVMIPGEHSDDAVVSWGHHFELIVLLADGGASD